MRNGSHVGDYYGILSRLRGHCLSVGLLRIALVVGWLTVGGLSELRLRHHGVPVGQLPERGLGICRWGEGSWWV